MKKLSAVSTLLVLILVSSTSSGQSLTTNGTGEYTEFNKTTMVIKLELSDPAGEALEAIALDTNKKLSFRILDDRTPRMWTRIWIQNLSINNPPDTITKQTDDLIRMTQVVKGDLTAGDLIEYERVSNNLTTMTVNGVEVEQFNTAEFFEFLLSAFIGPVPPSSQLKARLLASGDADESASQLFDSISYDQARASLAAEWLPEQPAPDSSASSSDSSSNPPSDTPQSQQTSAAEEAAASEQPATASEVIDVQSDEVVGASGNISAGTIDSGSGPDTVLPPPVSSVLAEEVLADEVGVTSEDRIEALSDSLDEQRRVDAGSSNQPVEITAESLLASQNYQRAVLASVYGNIRYPRAAIRRNREGALRLSISIDSDGSVLNTEIVQNSRFAPFDRSALDAVEDAAPFDPLPFGTLEVPMILEIPVSFKLQ